MGLAKLLIMCVLFGICIPGNAESVELISYKSDGSAAHWSTFPEISIDGQQATFSSIDSLVPEDKNNTYDIYLRNLENGNLERISLAHDGSEANGHSYYASSVLSTDGRYVAFMSYASNLVPDDNNNMADIFIRDRLNGTTEIISVSTNGSQGTYASQYPSMSADGRYVAFHTTSDLCDDTYRWGSGVYLRDRQEKTTTWIGHGNFPAISSNGLYIAYRANVRDVALYDLTTGSSEALTDDPFFLYPYHLHPYAYQPSISGDGRYVTYEGRSAETAPLSPLSTEVFLYDRVSKSSKQVTRAFDGSPLVTASGPYDTPLRPRITDDGRYVFFFSNAADLVQGIDGNSLYKHDVVSEATTRIDVDNLWSTLLWPQFAVSGDGSNLVFADTINNHFPELNSTTQGVFSLLNITPPEEETSEDVALDVSLETEPNLLWPPNSKLVEVEITVDAPAESTIKVEIIDEYGVFNQTTFGSSVVIPLEAWRDGKDKDGRTYTVNATVSSDTGQKKTVSSEVIVPHDKR